MKKSAYLYTSIYLQGGFFGWPSYNLSELTLCDDEKENKIIQ